MEHNFDLFVGNILVSNLDGSCWVSDILSTEICSLYQSIRHYHINKLGDLHAKVFKSSIFKQYSMKFNEAVRYAEDGLFFNEYLIYVQNVAIDNYVCYHYMRNESGLSFKMNTHQSESICFHSYYTVMNKLAVKLSCPLEEVFNPWIAFRYLYTSFIEYDKVRFVQSLKSLSAEKLQIVAKSVKAKRFGKYLSKAIYSEYYGLAYNLCHITFFKVGVCKIFRRNFGTLG